MDQGHRALVATRRDERHGLGVDDGAPGDVAGLAGEGDWEVGRVGRGQVGCQVGASVLAARGFLRGFGGRRLARALLAFVVCDRREDLVVNFHVLLLVAVVLVLLVLVLLFLALFLALRIRGRRVFVSLLLAVARLTVLLLLAAVEAGEENAHVQAHALVKRTASTLLAVPPDLQPVLQRKVDRLGRVIPQVVPRVVGLGVDDDKVARLLDGLDVVDVERPQQARRDEDVLVAHKLTAVGRELREQLPGHGVKLVRLAGRHAVPHLGRASVQVVDAIEVQILLVPGEERLPHAKVGHRGGHAANLRHVVLLPQAAQVAQVPAPAHLFVKETHDRVGAVDGRVEGDARPEGPLHEVLLLLLPLAALSTLHLPVPLLPDPGLAARRRLPVLLGRDGLILRGRHRLLLFEDGHVGPRATKHVLLDRRVDLQRLHVLLLELLAAGLVPRGRRDPHARAVRVLLEERSHVLGKRTGKLLAGRRQVDAETCVCGRACVSVSVCVCNCIRLLLRVRGVGRVMGDVRGATGALASPVERGRRRYLSRGGRLRRRLDVLDLLVGRRDRVRYLDVLPTDLVGRGAKGRLNRLNQGCQGHVGNDATSRGDRLARCLLFPPAYRETCACSGVERAQNGRGNLNGFDQLKCRELGAAAVGGGLDRVSGLCRVRE